jgi:ATP adenylyltransferase
MQSLWAPWRVEYVKGIDRPSGECFLCEAATAVDPEAHLRLVRGERAFIMLNRFPYNPGHLLISCHDHVAGIEDVGEACSAEIWKLAAIAKRLLGEVMHAHGFNLGINQGSCAGAGHDDHLHLHLVPRWSGDSNFLPVVGSARVFSQGLDDLYAQLRPRFAALGLDT